MTRVTIISQTSKCNFYWIQITFTFCPQTPLFRYGLALNISVFMTFTKNHSFHYKHAELINLWLKYLKASRLAKLDKRSVNKISPLSDPIRGNLLKLKQLQFVQLKGYCQFEVQINMLKRKFVFEKRKVTLKVKNWIFFVIVGTQTEYSVHFLDLKTSS